MDAMEFTTSRTADGVVVDFLDPDVLFREGVQAWEDKHWEDAVRKFGLILGRFADSRFARPALYNRGLALLSAPRPAEAARDFDEYLRRYPDDPELADALLKAGEAWQECGEWAKAEEVLNRRLTLEPLTLLQEMEARARLARALRMQGRYEESREQVTRVQALADRNATRPEIQGNYFAAMATFEGAEAWHDLFSRVKFTLPTDRMEKDLTDKATLFLKAQGEYLRTLRMRNVFWGVQAGTRMGRMYEEFYDDIMNAEVPPEFSQEDLKVYMGELRRKARPLVAKAVAAYERNLSLAKMYGARDEWLGDMANRLSRLRQILAESPADE
jgi:tetratricopeptide (TPR) repeat protein